MSNYNNKIVIRWKNVLGFNGWFRLLFVFPHRSLLHPRSWLVRILCQQGQDTSLQRHHRTSVEWSQSPGHFLLLHHYHYHRADIWFLFFCVAVILKGVWNRAGGLPVPADPVLWEMLRQKHAQQERQRDRGQDHGKRAGPGRGTASPHGKYTHRPQRVTSVFSRGHFPACDSF